MLYVSGIAACHPAVFWLSRKWLERRKSKAIEGNLFLCVHRFQIICT